MDGDPAGREKRERLKRLLRERAGRSKTAPVSLGQERLWFLSQLAPTSTIFCECRAVRISLPLRRDLLEQALFEIVRRHEILRTSFSSVQGRPVQRIHPVGEPQLRFEDLSRLAGVELDTAVERVAGEEMSKPFDLGQARLFRLALLDCGEDTHIVIVTMHHIIADGWSIGVMLRELLQLSISAWSGTAPALPALALQYAEYARRQRRQVENDRLAHQLDYWRKRLDGLERLGLPTDRPRPKLQTFRGGTHEFEIPAPVVRALTDLGREERCTPFMVLLGAFQLLLARYSGQEDISVGSPSAGREGRETEGMIGFFVNMLVLRTDVAGDPSFRELLGRVRDTCLGAFANDALPFAGLVERLKPERSLSHEPFFQVVFSFLSDMMSIPEIPGLARYPLPGHSTSKYDLSLYLHEGPGALSGFFEFNTDLFDEATIVSLSRHLVNLVESIADDPDRRLSKLSMLDESERKSLLALGAAPPTSQVQSCVHEQFAIQAGRTPSAPALHGATITLSYGELDALAGRLSRRLRRCGVGGETRVGIYIEGSPEMVLACLGVLRAGGAFVPLAVDDPPERLAFLLADAELRVVVTRRQLAAGLPEHDGRLVFLDDLRDASLADGEDPSETRASPENTAYVIYTSGSTGRPKGVEVPHAGLSNLVQWHREAYGVTPRDRATQLAAPVFDASVWEVWPYLTAGASVYFPGQDARASPARLTEYLAEHDITICFAPTPMAERLLQGPAPALPELRTLLTGGERLRARPRAEIPFRVENHYGPTECTVVATHCRVLPAGDEAGPPPIGRPIAGVGLLVLDRMQNLVPLGVPGELCITGVGLARGYLRRPELTAAKFTSDPFDVRPGSRMYRTGDRVRWRADGNLEFLERIDDQLKIRGVRIEPGEIEALLLDHGAVEQALVVARRANGEAALVAYVAGRGASGPSPEDLREHLRRRLPESMLPAAFVVLDSLPRTPAGKLARNALPAAGREASTAGVYEAPQTDTERRLAEIWSGLLGVERVGRRDDFFDLGGHSLLAVELAARIEQTFQVALPLPALFDAPTVAGQARSLDALMLGGAPAHAPGPELERDAVLDPSIRAGEGTVVPAEGWTRVLLTGATGFLGAFLLSELLQQTQAEIHCVVRGGAAGAERIREALVRYGLWDDAVASRIVAVSGDLERPRLGLDADGFDRLAAEIDVVYHNAANVNFLYPYRTLKPANVLGTHEVLRLAGCGRIKPVHFVSTLSVIPSDAGVAGKAVLESDQLCPGHALEGGYAQSKWVAEKLVRIADSRGMPVSVYRPGRVAGHSRSGVSNTDDLLVKIIQRCVELGRVPQLASETLLDLTPVDYVSRAIVHLSRQERSRGRTFHLVNPAPMRWDELVRAIRSSGYPVQEIPLQSWAAQALGFDAGARFQEEIPRRLQLPAVDRRNTLAGTRDTALRCPPADERLIRTYLARLVQAGMTAPGGAAKA